MPPSAPKTRAATFPLRLMPALRRTAESLSKKEGVSLNQFINLAVAEKLAILQQEEWLRNRRVPTEESIAEALAILDRSGTLPPEPGDELPDEAHALLDRNRNRPVEPEAEPQLTAR